MTAPELPGGASGKYVQGVDEQLRPGAFQGVAPSPSLDLREHEAAGAGVETHVRVDLLAREHLREPLELPEREVRRADAHRRERGRGRGPVSAFEGEFGGAGIWSRPRDRTGKLDAYIAPSVVVRSGGRGAPGRRPSMSR